MIFVVFKIHISIFNWDYKYKTTLTGAGYHLFFWFNGYRKPKNSKRHRTEHHLVMILVWGLGWPYPIKRVVCPPVIKHSGWEMPYKWRFFAGKIIYIHNWLVVSNKPGLKTWQNRGRLSQANLSSCAYLDGVWMGPSGVVSRNVHPLLENAG